MKPKQPNQLCPTKPNNQTYQTKLTNLQNQTFQTKTDHIKITKPNLAKLNFELSIEKNANLPSEQGPGFSGFCGALPSEQRGEEPSLERTI